MIMIYILKWYKIWIDEDVVDDDGSINQSIRKQKENNEGHLHQKKMSKLIARK